LSVIVTIFLCSLFAPSLAFSGDIIHDSEFQLLQKQRGDKWAEEDKEIEEKLESLLKQYGKRPNIIHIMWDDMK
jgi:arylsulfatase